MTCPWKEDPSMQIQLCCRRPEKNSDPAKKSHSHLTLVSLSPLIQPSIQLSIHPSVQLSLPVSTAFAFSSRIEPLSLSLAFALFLSPQLLGVTLSHVSLPSFNTQFASNTSRTLPMRSRRAKGQALKTVCVHTNTVSYLNCSAREEISVKGKENSSRTGKELGSEAAG